MKYPEPVGMTGSNQITLAGHLVGERALGEVIRGEVREGRQLLNSNSKRFDPRWLSVVIGSGLG